MKKWTTALVLFVLIALVACSSAPGASQAAPTPAVVVPVKASGNIMADAIVTPVRWMTLSFQMGGVVKTVNVHEGDFVKAGQVIAALDDTDIRLSIAQAEAALALAQAQLAQLKAPPQPAQIAVAEQAIQEADAAVLAASARLAQVQRGVTAADIAAAEAALAQAQAQQRQAQEQYNKTLECYDVQLPGGSKQEVCPGLGAPEEQARAALEAAKQNTAAAQKRLDQLKAGPTKSELDAARANLAAAQAQKARAQAQLDLLKAGATPEQIAVAEAGVKQAQVAVDVAKAQLARLQLVAPFDGTLVTFNLQVGELASPGAPVAKLADLSEWQIETDDLTELNIVRVKEGSPVTITFDAIPDLELTGKVVRIKSLGEDKRGDITYTVIIRPDKHDERLRWNMTASVSIEPR